MVFVTLKMVRKLKRTPKIQLSRKSRLMVDLNVKTPIVTKYSQKFRICRCTTKCLMKDFHSNAIFVATRQQEATLCENTNNIVIKCLINKDYY